MSTHLTRRSLALFALLVGCARRDEPTSTTPSPVTFTPSSTSRGAAIVDRARDLFGSRDDARLLLSALGTRTYAQVALEEREAIRSGDRTRVTAPLVASGAVRIEASGLQVDVRPRGLAPTPIEWGDGLAVFPEVQDAAHLLRRVDDRGVEDLFQLDRARDQIVFTYDVALSGVAGLRLVDGDLERLEAAGAPRLRAPAPIVFDANGARRRGALEVHGCAYDTSPRGPWGRPVTAPGSDTCTIVARVDGRGLAYPVLVDPAWESTTSSKYTHYRHHALRLSAGADAGKVLVVAGGGNFTQITELFDPVTATWASGASLPIGTDVQEGSRVVELASGRVVLAGGIPSGGSASARKSVFLRDETTGAWSAGADMSVGRGWHAMQVVPRPGGKQAILVAGGQPEPALKKTSPASDHPPHATSELYDPETNTWTSLGLLKAGRTKMGWGLLADGRMIVVGGENLNGTSSTSVKEIDTSEIYDPTLDGWLSGPKLGARRTSPAVAAIQGGTKVLVAGGYGGAAISSTALDTVEILDVASGTSTTLATKMSTVRRDFAATTLLDGRVLFVGGDVATSTISVAPTTLVDVFTPGAGATVAAITSTANLLEPRVQHATTLLADGSVLVTGGWTGTTGATQSKTAELLDLELGKTCGATGDCPSGRFCVDGVCCASSACGAGETCNAPGREGRCVKAKGASCTSAAECATGFCVDGVCCADACTGVCRSCNLAGTEGTCTIAPVETDPRLNCRGSSDPTCAKRCDGAGKCQSAYKPVGTACGASLDPDAGLPFCTAYMCTSSGSCTSGTNRCGLTCVSASTCNESTKSCTVTGTINANSCLIDGACFTTGQTDPSDPCRICDPGTSNTSWTVSLGCDAGTPDTGIDAEGDAADADTDAVADTGASDTGTPEDAQVEDTAPADTGAATDSAVAPDATSDVPAEEPLPEASACGCRVPGSSSGATGAGSAAAALAVLGVMARLRRRLQRGAAPLVATGVVLGCSASSDPGGGAPALDAGGLDTAVVEPDTAAPEFDIGVPETPEDAACVGKEVAAIKPPVDIVMVVDQSGSMSNEILQVKANINKLSEQLNKAYLDYRVVMIARVGNDSYGVCVPPPLGGPDCKSNAPIFRASNQEVQSTDALTRILQTWDSLLPSLGWRDMMREESTKVFIPVTDDNATAPKPVAPAVSVAQQFDAELLSRSAAFGNATKRRYRFYPICGASASDPYSTCGTGMVNAGSTYIELAKMTGGKNFPLCASDFGPLFIDIAKSLASDLACELTLPPPPDGATLDHDKVNVLYTPSDGSPAVLVAQDASKPCEAGANGWQYDADKTKIVLCGDACAKVKDDLGAKVNIQFGCKTRID